MDKPERGHRLRGSRLLPSERRPLRFAGIDIAAESHVVAVVDEGGQSLGKPVTVREEANGYRRLREVLGTPQDLFVAMEATGHDWQTVCACLTAAGVAVAVLNPRRTHHCVGEELARAKTDALDATAIARFAAQKRPPVTPVPDAVTQELRELVRRRDRGVHDFGDRLRQLHRLVDVGFPECTQPVRRLDSQRATTILRQHPTAIAVRTASLTRLTPLRDDGRPKVGVDRAHTLIDAAQTAVGSHHGPASHRHIRYVCEDLDCRRRRVQDLEVEITRTLATHEIGTLLTTIDGIGPQTAARLLREVGNPAAFRRAAALAAYVGAVPGTRQSGTRRVLHAGLAPVGHSRLRAALWRPTLVAVRKNPWVRAFSERLRARGKLAKGALVAARRQFLVAIYAVAKSRRPFVPALTTMEVPTC